MKFSFFVPIFNLWPPPPPQGSASFDPRGILWTNLVEVNKDMPHTKYQISTPSNFREENFWRWASLFLCSNLRPLERGQFLPQGHHMKRTWWRSSRRCSIPHIKALGLPVSEKKNFEIFFLCSYVPTCDPQSRASFHLRGMTWTNFVDTRRCYIPSIKALAVTVWGKKIFKNFLLYLYVKSETPQHKTNFHSKAIIWSLLIEAH